MPFRILSAHSNRITEPPDKIINGNSKLKIMAKKLIELHKEWCESGELPDVATQPSKPEYGNYYLRGKNGRYRKMKKLNSNQSVQECDARDDDSSNSVK